MEGGRPAPGGGSLLFGPSHSIHPVTFLLHIRTTYAPLAGVKPNDAHESVNSVVSRILAADDASGASTDLPPATSRSSTSAFTPVPLALPLGAASAALTPAGPSSAGPEPGVGPSPGTPSPSLPGFPSLTPMAPRAALSPLDGGATSKMAAMTLSASGATTSQAEAAYAQRQGSSSYGQFAHQASSRDATDISEASTSMGQAEYAAVWPVDEIAATGGGSISGANPQARVRESAGEVSANDVFLESSQGPPPRRTPYGAATAVAVGDGTEQPPAAFDDFIRRLQAGGKADGPVSVSSPARVSRMAPGQALSSWLDEGGPRAGGAGGHASGLGLGDVAAGASLGSQGAGQSHRVQQSFNMFLSHGEGGGGGGTAGAGGAEMGGAGSTMELRRRVGGDWGVCGWGRVGLFNQSSRHFPVLVVVVVAVPWQ